VAPTTAYIGVGACSVLISVDAWSTRVPFGTCPVPVCVLWVWLPSNASLQHRLLLRMYASSTCSCVVPLCDDQEKSDAAVASAARARLYWF
jgi:hypothetical protein